MIGAHWIGPGSPHDLLDVCAAAAAQGTPVPYVVVVNEDKAVALVKAISPSTLVTFRVTGRDSIPNPGYEAGRQRVRDLTPLFRAAGADVFSIANEWLPRDVPAVLAAGAQTYIGAMDEADDQGFTICVGDLNTGHPNLDNPANLDALRPMLVRAEQGGHYLNVHYYAPGGDPTNDPDAMLWQRIVADYPRLRVLISEYGVLENDGRMVGGEAFVRMIDSCNRMLALFEQVEGVALYTLTASTWKQCDWYSERERYVNWLRAL